MELLNAICITLWMLGLCVGGLIIAARDDQEFFKQLEGGQQ